MTGIGIGISDFKALRLRDNYYTSKQGYYPCIYITLKDVRGRNFNDIMLSLQTELVELFIEHVKLLESDKLLDIEKEMFSTILNLKAKK